MAPSAALDDRAKDTYRLRDGEAEKLLAGVPWRRVVVLGDGGTAERVDDRRPWAAQVAAALRAVHPDLAYLPLGRQRLLAADIRLQQLESALAFNADLALVHCGAHEVLRRGFDPDVVEVEVSRIVAPLRAAGCQVLTMGVHDVSKAAHIPADKRAALRIRLTVLQERIRAVALHHGTLHVDLADHRAGGADDIWHPDGGLSERGHAITAAAVIRRLGAHHGATVRAARRRGPEPDVNIDTTVSEGSQALL